MPKLPDITDLGARPTPVSRRQIATNPRPGVVGDAVADLGAQIAGVGIKMNEQRDQLDAAKAKAEFLKRDALTRQELEKDAAGYKTWEQRYTEAMKSAREDASKMIRSRSGRAMFEMETDLDIIRGQGVLAEGARKRDVDAQRGQLQESLAGLQDFALDEKDDAIRENNISAASNLIQAAQNSGIISATDAQDMRRSWTQNYVVQRYETLKRAGDLEGSEKWLNANRNRIDPSAEISLYNGLEDAKQDRFVLNTAEQFVAGISIRDTTAKQSQFTDPLRGRKAVTVEGGKFGAPRDGGSRTHSGVDYAIARGTPIMSGAGAGKATVSKSAKGGNIVTIDHGNGVVTKYMHLDSVNVKTGQQVTDETVLGGVGSTGASSSGNHLHYEVYVDGKKVDPTSIAGTPRQAPRMHDMNSVYRDIDARADKEEWTPELRERVKAQAAKLIERDNVLLERQYRDASGEAAIAIANLPEGITSLEQIPKATRDKMDPVQLAELGAKIRESNRKAAEIKPGGSRSLELDIMRRVDPVGFSKLDLTKDVGKVTDGELRTFILAQADLIAKPKEGPDYRQGIQSAITWGSKYGGVKVSDEDFAAVYDTMNGFIEKVAKTRTPTKDDYDEAFKSATREVKLTGGIWFDRSKPLYDLSVGDLPNSVVADIKKAWPGKEPPTDEQVLEVFRARYADRVR